LVLGNTYTRMTGYDKMLLAILGYFNELQCTKGTEEDMHA